MKIRVNPFMKKMSWKGADCSARLTLESDENLYVKQTKTNFLDTKTSL